MQAALGISVKSEPLAVEGRILLPPTVWYGPTKLDPCDGAWNMASCKFTKGTVLKHLGCYQITTPGPRELDDDEQMERALKRVLRRFYEQSNRDGVQINRYSQGSIRHLRGEDDEALEDVFVNAKQEGYDALLLVIPDNVKLLRCRIKELGDCRLGLPTTCCRASKFLRGSPQYFGNVLLKVNLKLGGVNQLVESDSMELINEGKTMVVGIDVTHPGNIPEAPSIAAMVASRETDLAQWPVEFHIQKPRQEKVDKIGSMLTAHIEGWMKAHPNSPSLPENILILRDGVSEGQRAMVVDEEAVAVDKACRALYAHNKLPKITIVVIEKRNQVRFYPTSAKAGTFIHRTANNPPGTHVDRGITNTRLWDFWLQSHATLQGTARFTHYVVVRDEIFRSRWGDAAVNTLEHLMYSLSHLCGPATRAIRIPVPVYYVDRALEHVRSYMWGLFNREKCEAFLRRKTGLRPDVAARLFLRETRSAVHSSIHGTMFYA